MRTRFLTRGWLLGCCWGC